MRLLRMEETVKAIAFSKDRALQLDGLLRSLVLHAAEPVEASVIAKATSARHAAAYAELACAHPATRIIGEGDFEADVRQLLADAGDHVLFLVDDTLFVRPWSPALCVAALDRHPDALGFSLRLGRNTTYCYPAARVQAVPRFAVSNGGEMVGWQWAGPDADGDFAYPLEVSSSVYRTQDILDILTGVGFRNPNELELVLASRAPAAAHLRPSLLALGTSVAFSNPCNKVQEVFANRAGSEPARSPEALLELWEEGYRLDVAALAGHTPRGAHEEAALVLVRGG